MKKIIFRCALILMGAFVFASCSDEDNPADDDNIGGENNKPSAELIAATDGVYILCEGSFYSGVAGSLSYLDYSAWQVTNDVFLAANDGVLGGTPNDILIYGSKMYIATTDENRVWIVDANTVKSLGYAELTQPRKLTACDGAVYVTSYEGIVSRIDTTSMAIVAQSEKIGENLEGITARNGYLYVCNAWNNDYSYNTNVVKLNASTLAKVKDIEVHTNPTRILTDGTDIYLQSTGNYYDIPSALQKIDADDNMTLLAEDITYMAYYDNKIYYIFQDYGDYGMTVDTFNAYDLATGERTALSLNADREVFCACAIAVDPNTGIVYVSSYALGAWGYPSYDEPGYVIAYNPDGTYSRFNTGVAPTSYAFKTSTHIVEQ